MNLLHLLEDFFENICLFLCVNTEVNFDASRRARLLHKLANPCLENFFEWTRSSVKTRCECGNTVAH